MAEFELIPHPVRVRRSDTGFDLAGGVEPEPLPRQLSGLRAAVDACASRLSRPEASGPSTRSPDWRIVVRHDDSLADQAYRLTITDQRIEITCATVAGGRYALATVHDLWDQTGPRLPGIEIDDEPAIAHRGMFIESFNGTDAMGRDDWRALIDRLAGLRFNHLAVSLHGCWDLRHDASRAEQLWLTLPSFPHVATPQRVRTWDPDSGAEVVRDYLPAMVADPGLWPDVVAYAGSRGLDVTVVWGGPAHSSLLPRSIPRLSARAGDATEKGYGFCVTDPQARDAISQVFDDLCRAAIVPHGVAQVCVGGDEYYPIANVDPDDPLTTVTPWCECAGCADRSPAQQLVDYLTLAASVLRRHHVPVAVYGDSLIREDCRDLLLDSFAAAGLDAPTEIYWGYVDPIPAGTPVGEQTWVMPTTGLINTLFTQDTSDNIETWLREAARLGAGGVLAYSMPDPAQHKNVACLADLAWSADDPSARVFDERWARRVGGAAATEVLRRYDAAEAVVGMRPLMMYVVNHLMPYFATAPHGVHTFPDDALRAVTVPIPAYLPLLRQLAVTLRGSVDAFPATVAVRDWPDVSASWTAELERIADHVDLFCDLAELARSLHRRSLAEAEDDIAGLERAGLAMLRRIAQTKSGYLRDVVLREHWGVIGQIRPALERMDSEGRLPPPDPSWHAWLL